MLWPAVFFFSCCRYQTIICHSRNCLLCSHINGLLWQATRTRWRSFFFFSRVIKKEFLLTKSVHYQAEGWWEEKWKYEIWNTVYLSTKISQNYKKQIEDSAAYWYLYLRSTIVKKVFFIDTLHALGFVWLLWN